MSLTPQPGLLAIAAPLRVWAQRFAVALLAGTAVFMIFVGRLDPRTTQRLRMNVLDYASVPLEALRRPVDFGVAAVKALRSQAELRHAIGLLEADRALLLGYQARALSLELENAELRALLKVPADPAARFVTARVVADTGGAFVKSVLIAAGHRDGVRRGQPVVNQKGLVGRIAEVGERSALVLLLTDLNSHVPAIVEASGDRAIAAGDNSASLRLNFLPTEARIEPGARVLTSGHGGLFPPGLLIGVVAESGEKGVRVTPAAELDGIDFVRVLDFGPGGFAAAPEAATPKNAR